MGEYDVDDLLEQAFKRVEDSDKNGNNSSKTPMDDIISEEARKSGINVPAKDDYYSKRRSDDPKRRRDRSTSSNEDSSRRSKRSRSRDAKRDDSSRSGRGKKRSKSRSPSSSKSRKRNCSSDRRRSSRSRSPRAIERRDRRDRRRSSRSRSRERASYARPLRRSRSPIRRSPSPGWRRSPPRVRLPGPERRDVMPFTARRSPPPNAKLDMTVEERDERTIFILQLARNTRPRDLEDFFSSVGHVRDVRIITDSKTRRSKGIAYVEFWEKDGVALAMGLNGQKLVGAPLVIQMTCAERNRLANGSMGGAIGLGLTGADTTGPLKFCVSNLHPKITDDMLAGIFEPFGRIDRCEVVKDSSSKVSKGYGYVSFRHVDEGKRALEQLNGFEVAGKNIRITTMDEDEFGRPQPPSLPQSQQIQQHQKESLVGQDKMITSQGRRRDLMTKLAQGTDMEMSPTDNDIMLGAPPPPPPPPQHQQSFQNSFKMEEQDPEIPSIATQCFMLSNMFDPSAETEPGWELDVQDDVIEECNNNGGCVHIYIDKTSAQGNVYVKCPTISIAYRSVKALHGRWFAGKIITANYVPLVSYHDLFPESRLAQATLVPRQR